MSIMTDADFTNAIDNDLIARAVEDTEHEIMDHALGNDEPDPNEAVNFDTSLEQTEGFDGRPLSDEEQWEGYHPGSGFDRPIEFAQEKNEFDTAISERDALKAENARLVQTYDPQIREKAQAESDRIADELVMRVATDPSKFRAEERQLVQQVAHQQAQAMRADATFREAAEDHGEDAFKAAYAKLYATGSAEHQRFGNSATVREILHAPNPGRALMTWARGGGSSQTGDRSGPPFMPGMHRSAAPQRAASREAMSTWESRASLPSFAGQHELGSEQEILDYALRR